MKTVGIAMPRIDGPLKTSGTAMYASDHHFPGMLYAVAVGSTIANGKIERMDVAAAEKMPGVHAVLHHGNMDKIFRTAPDSDFTAYMDEQRPAFEDDVIRYYGQYVALAVAETFEQAQAAARAVRVTYRSEKPNVSEELGLKEMKDLGEMSKRGDLEKAFAAAPVKVDQTYTTPSETHSAIELHATVAVWEGDILTLHETSQGVTNHRNVLVQQLGTPKEKVQVISKFLGSGFGGKLFPWPHSALAGAAARQVG
ncbi:xanthine dehydrogenase family protein molybdopterin-binding subunit, partial [bacterium]